MAACAQTWGNGTGNCYNYVASVSRPLDTENHTFRVDQNFGAADRLYFTGIRGEQNYHNANVIPLSGSLTHQQNYLYGLNWEHTLGQTTLNSLRFGYNWQIWYNGVDSAASGINYGAQLGFQNARSEEHTSELQSRLHLVCRLLLEKKKTTASTALANEQRRDHAC